MFFYSFTFFLSNTYWLNLIILCRSSENVFFSNFFLKLNVQSKVCELKRCLSWNSGKPHGQNANRIENCKQNLPPPTRHGNAPLSTQGLCFVFFCFSIKFFFIFLCSGSFSSSYVSVLNAWPCSHRLWSGISSPKESPWSHVSPRQSKRNFQWFPSPASWTWQRNLSLHSGSQLGKNPEVLHQTFRCTK